jgi:hypothetical protein
VTHHYDNVHWEWLEEWPVQEWLYLGAAIPVDKDPSSGRGNHVEESAGPMQNPRPAGPSQSRHVLGEAGRRKSNSKGTSSRRAPCDTTARKPARSQSSEFIENMSAKGSRFKGSQLHSQTIAQGKVPVGFMVTRGAKSKRSQPLHTGGYTEVLGNVICHPNGHTYGQLPTSHHPPTARFYQLLKNLDMGAPCCAAFVTRRTDKKDNAALVSRTRLLFLALEAGPSCLLSQCNRAILEPLAKNHGFIAMTM